MSHSRTTGKSRAGSARPVTTGVLAGLLAVAVAQVAIAQSSTDPMSGMPSASGMDAMPGAQPMPGTQPMPMGDPSMMGAMPPAAPMPQPMPAQMQMAPPAMAPAAPTTGAGFKQMFAGTLSAVLQATGAGLATSLATGLTGAITGWFTRPQRPQPAMLQPAMAAPMPSAPMGGMPAAAPMGAMPSASMSATPAMGGMSGDMGGMTGAAPAPMGAMGSMPAATPPMPAELYAGLAYEVHATGRDGSVQRVDPAAHTFSTGDRFVVLYRPTLPGRVRILNVNPLGQESEIDAVNVAAGELARLGPYEFRGNKGEERLRLVLSPCRSDQMMAATRDIVRADAPPSAGAAYGGMPAAAPPTAMPGLGLQSCDAPLGTRSLGVKTRDIAKVAVEDGTMYALDPISKQEASTGLIAPREITLTFRHQ